MLNHWAFLYGLTKFWGKQITSAGPAVSKNKVLIKTNVHLSLYSIAKLNDKIIIDEFIGKSLS